VGSFKVSKPTRRELSEDEFKRVYKRRLNVPEGEVKGRGVAANFGTDGDGQESVLGADVYLVVSEGMEWGDEVRGGEV